MMIEKIDIKGFGKHRDLSLLLGKGMNIIYGSNESGKTTLQWFLRAMLYGLKGGRTAKDGLLPPQKRFKPWQGGIYGGSLSYRLDNQRNYRIERNFDTGIARIYDGQLNDITAQYEVGKEKTLSIADEHLGLSEACFDKTVCIRQLHTRVDEDGSHELVSRLVNAAQTGNEEVSFRHACHALKDALKLYVGTDKTTTRPLDKINLRIQELMLQYERQKERRNFKSDHEKKLKEAWAVKEDMQRVKACLETAKVALLAGKRLADLREQREILTASYYACERIEPAIEKAMNEQKHTRLSEDQGQQKHPSTYKGILLGSVSLFALAIVSLLYGLLQDAKGFIAALGLAIVALGLGIGRGLVSKKENQTTKVQEADLNLRHQADEALQKILSLNGQLKNQLSKASLVLGRQLDTKEDIKNAVDTLQQEYVKETKKHERGLDTLKLLLEEDETFQSCPSIAIECVSILEAKKLERMHEAMLLLDSEQEKLQYELGLMGLEIKEYETLLASAEEEDSFSLVEEELIKLNKQKHFLEDTGASLELALEVLTQAGLEIQRDYIPALNHQMSRIMEKISGGRYALLKTDDQLTLKTILSETGAVVPSVMLSGGTIDQMYLSLRLAMADFISKGNECLPFIMDEILAQYDDERAKKVFSYMDTASVERQFIFFTCRRREVEMAKEVCTRELKVFTL